MKKTDDRDYNIIKWICDECESDSIKGSVITQFKIELDTLNNKLTNLEKTYEIEKLTDDKETHFIEDLQTVIDETKKDVLHRENDLSLELTLLEQDIDKINADYKEIESNLQLLILQNNEYDEKQKVIFEQIHDFSSFSSDEELLQNMQTLKNEIKEINEKIFNENIYNQKKLDKNENYKILSLKDDIISLKNERKSISYKIAEIKQVEQIKESNISFLLTTLSTQSTNPDMAFSSLYFDNDETIRAQEAEIIKLENKIAKRHRKYSLEDKACNCEIY